MRDRNFIILTLEAQFLLAKMFSSGPSYAKLKTNLRLSINRLKLLEKKKAELAQKARKEIADYIAAGKVSFIIRKCK